MAHKKEQKMSRQIGTCDSFKRRQGRTRCNRLKDVLEIVYLIIKTLFIPLFYYSQVTKVREKGHCHKQQEKRSWNCLGRIQKCNFLSFEG